MVRSLCVFEHVKLTLPNGTVGGFWLCLWSINQSSYLAALGATKMLIEVRDARKNVFHIACHLASTSFFLGLLTTVLFHLVVGITRDECYSAFLWKLFCSPHKTL